LSGAATTAQLSAKSAFMAGRAAASATIVDAPTDSGHERIWSTGPFRCRFVSARPERRSVGPGQAARSVRPNRGLAMSSRRQAVGSPVSSRRRAGLRTIPRRRRNPDVEPPPSRPEPDVEAPPGRRNPDVEPRGARFRAAAGGRPHPDVEMTRAVSSNR
jgi:hypothetical protein